MKGPRKRSIPRRDRVPRGDVGGALRVYSARMTDEALDHALLGHSGRR